MELKMSQSEMRTRYNAAAAQLGRPSVLRFASLAIAVRRTEAIEAEASALNKPKFDRGIDLNETLGAGEPIPEFLKVENRVSLPPEKQAQLAEVQHAAKTSTRKGKRDFAQPQGMADEDWRAHKAAQKKEKETTKKERLRELQERKALAKRSVDTTAAAPTSKPSTSLVQNVSRSGYGDTDTVVILVKDNPHRDGTKNNVRFAKILGARTVGEVVQRGVETSYLRYAAGRGILQVRN
jgi:hypothetical protein